MASLRATACRCTHCVGACASGVPCTGTPADMAAICRAGHAGRLMLERLVTPGGHVIYYLRPAIAHHEGKEAPRYLVPGRCAFLGPTDLCTLHTVGLKPTEGRLALLCNPAYPSDVVFRQLVNQWRGRPGRALVRWWRRRVGMGVAKKGRGKAWKHAS